MVVRHVQRGITLIELMVVVATVGLLAAIAIPVYQEFTIRAKVTEAVAAMSSVKATVAQFYIANGSMPPNSLFSGQGSVFQALDTKYVQNAAWGRLGRDSGDILVRIKDLGGTTAAGQEIALRAFGNSDRVDWSCGQAFGPSVPERYRPANCRQNLSVP